MEPPNHSICAEPITVRKERDKELEGLASLEYHDRLSHFIRGSTIHSLNNNSTPTTTVVDFRPLYAVNIYNLQRQLVQEIHHVQSETLTDGQLARMQKALSQYC